MKLAFLISIAVSVSGFGQTVDYVLDWTGGSPGANLTFATLLAGTHGPTNSSTWQHFTSTNLTFDNSLTCPSLGQVTINNYGTFIPSTSVLKSLSPLPGFGSAVWFFPTNAPSSMSVGYPFYTDCPQNANPAWDTFVIDSGSSAFMNEELLGDGTKLYWAEEMAGTGGSTSFPLVTNGTGAWFWKTLGWNVSTSNYVSRTYTFPGLQLVGELGHTNVVQSILPTKITIGIQFHSINAASDGKSCWFGPVFVNTTTATFPLLPTVGATLNTVTLNFDRIVRAQ